MTEADRYADKIAKLLRKAESTTPEEAELLMAKAQELMTLYAIDEEMLARVAGAQRQTSDHIEEKTIEFRGGYRPALRDIASVVARHNHCKVLFSSHPTKEVLYLHVVGFTRDIAHVEFLNASLQIQAQRAMMNFWKGRWEHASLGRQRAWQTKRTFLFGFAAGLEEKLAAAAWRGREEAIKRQAERGDTAASESVALVLRSKSEQVQGWIDEKYGTRLKSVRHNYSYAGGWEDGRQAGRTADTGDRMGGSRRKELN